MPVWIAFLLVTCIWGSTPLAIQWSQTQLDYQLAVTLRMGIGAVIFLLLLPWLRRKPAPTKQIVRLALIGGVSMFLSMYCVYWGARFVPSGIISVLFGLGPMITGLLAVPWLQEPFPPHKLLGSLLGCAGLLVFFVGRQSWGEAFLTGILAIVVSVILYAMGNIAIKQHNQHVAPRWIAAGSLWVAFPLFASVWLLSSPQLPTHWDARALWAIGYLGIVANLIGFLSFYSLLQRSSAANATLVTLTAPAIALWMGTLLNGEALHRQLWMGTLLILGGLGLYHWGLPRRQQRPEQTPSDPPTP
jgi:drug/metabolite transporter (DMT)-like permease